MWNLYSQAKAWGQRPSTLFGIAEDCQYLCYCFDEAVLIFGKWVERWLDVRETKGANRGRHRYTLAQILDEGFTDKKRSQSLTGLLALMGGAAGMRS